MWLYLGSANFIFPDAHRVSYKVEYEKTKSICVLIYIFLAVLQLLVSHPFMDALASFFMLYNYSTMTIREHILVVNGSNIRPWWILHHYVSIAMAGTMLIWPNGPAYASIRNTIAYVSIFIAGVQLLQYRNQVRRLYTLRALSRVDAMETTTDTGMHHLDLSLFLLLPFLFFGHVSTSLFHPDNDP